MDLPLRHDADDLEYADLSQYRTCECGYKKVVFQSLGSAKLNLENPDAEGFRIRLITFCPSCKTTQGRGLAFRAETRMLAKEAVAVYNACESTYPERA